MKCPICEKEIEGFGFWNPNRTKKICRDCYIKNQTKYPEINIFGDRVV